MEPSSIVIRSDLGTRASRLGRLVVGRTILLVKADLRRRGTRGVPMWPDADVINILDMVVTGTRKSKH